MESFKQDAPNVTPSQFSNSELCNLKRLLAAAESELRDSNEEKKQLDRDIKKTKAELEETKSKLMAIETSLDISDARANKITCQLHKCIGERDIYQLMYATVQAEAIALRETRLQEI
jgi:septal ring factor EnvC (AmiA/AmiB activator)